MSGRRRRLRAARGAAFVTGVVALMVAGPAGARSAIRAYPGSTSQNAIAEVVLSGRRVDWFVQARVHCSDGSDRNETFQTDRSDHVRLGAGGRFAEHITNPTPGRDGTVRASIRGTVKSSRASGRFSASFSYRSGVTCRGVLRWKGRYRSQVTTYWLG